MARAPDPRPGTLNAPAALPPGPTGGSEANLSRLMNVNHN
jgi:hypothetical protein